MSLKAAGAPGLPGLVTYYRSREDFPRRALPNVNRRGLCRTWNILNLVYHNVPISWSAAGYLVRSSLSRSIPTFDVLIVINPALAVILHDQTSRHQVLKITFYGSNVTLGSRQSRCHMLMRTRKLVGHCQDHRSSSAAKVPSVKCPFLEMSACR